jgi:hypothetical protein
MAPYLGQQAVIFPSTAGTLRDPNNFGKEWRNAREELGVPEVTTYIQLPQDGRHADRRRRIVGANRRRPSWPLEGVDDTGPVHTRGRVHTQVADLLDRTVTKSGE